MHTLRADAVVHSRESSSEERGTYYFRGGQSRALFQFGACTTEWIETEAKEALVRGERRTPLGQILIELGFLNRSVVGPKIKGNPYVCVNGLCTPNFEVTYD